LGDIQAEQTELFAQHARNSVDGSHHGAGLVFRECPDVFGMSPRDDERVAAGPLSRNATLLSSSYTRHDGNTPSRILQNVQSTER
jgi:hypothetical protein